MKEAKSDWKNVDKETQDKLLRFVSDELTVAIRNNKKIDDEFKEYYGMIHGIRVKKPNDWESDIYLPEFLSRLLTQIGNFCAQYFSSTDYVDTALESDDPKDVAEARASKRLLNIILNDKYTYYYHKIVRTIMFVFTCGYGVIKGGYDQQIDSVISHHKQQSDFIKDETGMPMAEDGMPYMDPTTQKPAMMSTQTPIYRDEVKRDFPTFDVYPVQSVYMSPEYAYSLNDKKYVIFETEQTLEELKDDAGRLEYFNLDLLQEKDPEGKLGEKTYNADGKLDEPPDTVEKTFIVVERWGKFWYKDKDDTAIPEFEQDGQIDSKAELAECIITTVKDRSKDEPHTVIRFQKSPHTRRPMARFLCYVDMVNDNGFGDGEINRELQKAINDNYNLMNYRTKLAITPAFLGKRFSGIDEHVRITPEKVTMVENMTDLVEFKIQDNIQGGVIHQNLLSSRMDYIMATSPQTMGAGGGDRAETATVGNIINQRANVRIGMKSMNLEFIGFTEFYDMLLTLCNDFMLPETLENLIGEDAQYYNPKRKDKFRPVSQALENDDSKQFKTKMLQGLWGMTAPIQNPNTPQVLNMIWATIVDLMGSSYAPMKKVMFETDPETNLLYMLATGAKGMPTPPATPNPGQPAQNQSGQPQSQAEQQVRAQQPQGM